MLFLGVLIPVAAAAFIIYCIVLALGMLVMLLAEL